MTIPMRSFRHLLLLALGLTALPAAALIVSATATPTNLLPSTPAVNVTYTSSSLVPTTSVTGGGLCANVAAALRGGGVFNNPGLVCSAGYIGGAAISSITSNPQTNAEALALGNVSLTSSIVGHGGLAWFVRELTDGVVNQAVVIPVRVYAPGAVGTSAFADTLTVDASTGGSINVKANDLIGGRVADQFNSTASLITNGGLSALTLDSASGLMTVPPGQPPGTYAAAYQTCQAQTATGSCATAAVNITITGSVSASADAATLTASGGTISILANDTANGGAATTANVNVTLTSNGGISGASIASGVLNIPAGLAAGSYVLGYSICLTSGSPCSSTTVNLTISAVPVNATADNGTLGSAGGTLDILANDRINNQPATLSNADISLTSAGNATGANINAQGLLNIPGGLVAGTYSLQYRLCVKGTTNCASATVSVTISPPTAVLVARDDRVTIGVNGGVINVLANDTLNGRRPVAGESLVTLTSNGGLFALSVTADGVLSVPAGAPGSSIAATYRFCLRQTPDNCVTARVFIAYTTGTTETGGNGSRPPSVPGGIGTATVTTTGPSGQPITFVTSSSGTTAGAITDPLTFASVKLVFGTSESGQAEAFYRQSDRISPFGAQLNYTGSGMLRGRWEVVFPGDPLPSELDLFPEASLPASLRGQQQRYLLLDRVQVYLPPTGRLFLKGPDPERLPRNLAGPYLILLRVEATTGPNGQEGGRSAFPFPVLSYTLQTADPRTPLSAGSSSVAQFDSLGELNNGALRLDGSAMRPAPVGEGFKPLGPGKLALMLPQDNASWPAGRSHEFAWADAADIALYQLEVQTAEGKTLLSALVKPGIGKYGLNPVLRQALPANGLVRWRVSGLDQEGRVRAIADWRVLRLE